MIDNKLTIDELSNRRHYFRIEDKVYLGLGNISDGTSAAEHFDLSPAFGLLSEFQLMDVESKQLLRSITDKDKSLGQYLKLMNRKLDALSRVTALSNQATNQDEIEQINLSEGGIGVHTEDNYSPGDRVAIKLILLPSYCGMLLEGSVMCCNPPSDDEFYNLHIEFLQISDPHRQLIARHIMRKQTAAKQDNELEDQL